MSPDFGRIAARYGSIVTVYRYTDGEYVAAGSAKAFIHPITRRDRQYYSDTRTVLGEADPGRYLYLGPRTLDISPAREGYLDCGGVKYQLIREEKFEFGGMSHVWGLLKLAAEAGSPGK